MSTLKKKEKRVTVGSAKIAGSGFISFSDVVADEDQVVSNSTTVDFSTGNTNSKSLPMPALARASPVYTGKCVELSVACKKLLKKDSTTKLKALQEINAVLKTNNAAALDNDKDNRLIPEFLPFFAHALSKLCFDDSWQVRERLGQLLVAIVDGDKQALTPFMQDIIGPWWQLGADPVKEVQTTFQSAFDRAVPLKRRPLVLLHLSSSLLLHILRCCKMSSAELQELTQCSNDELDEKHERLLRSNIDGLAHLLCSLSVEQNESLIKTDSSELTLPTISTTTYADILSSSVLLQHAKSKHSSVRRAVYSVVSEFAERLVSTASLVLLERERESLLSVLLNALEEKFDQDLVEALHALLALAKRFPGFWNRGQSVNLLLQKLKMLKT
jgi:hypothetical protein